MPDQTEHRTPLDLAEVRAEYLVECGPCDYGVMSAGCACPSGDIRAVLQRALDEVEQLRRRIDCTNATMAGLVASTPTGPDRNLVAQCAAGARRALYPEEVESRG